MLSSCSLKAEKTQSENSSAQPTVPQIARGGLGAITAPNNAGQSPASSASSTHGAAGSAAHAPSPIAHPPGSSSSSALSGPPLFSFADLAARSNPAVVHVYIVHAQRRGFREVLGRGSGSGFVFDDQGHILTNYHVVENARAISVEFEDDSIARAQVIGADPLTDLAVLATEAKQPPTPLTLGDSEALRVGEWVMAIGNPFGLEHTVSAGIISARERTGRDVAPADSEAYYSYLQTDASINPGNSGGPLLNLRGEVVGINTAINPQANSISFAIPIDMVKQLLPGLLNEGRIRRAVLGVSVADLSFEDAQRLGLKKRHGAFVARLRRGGPAQRAGLIAGDLIIRVGQHAIRNSEKLRWYASLLPLNLPSEVEVLRDGKQLVFQIRPVELL